MSFITMEILVWHTVYKMYWKVAGETQDTFWKRGGVDDFVSLAPCTVWPDKSILQECTLAAIRVDILWVVDV